MCDRHDWPWGKSDRKGARQTSETTQINSENTDLQIRKVIMTQFSENRKTELALKKKKSNQGFSFLPFVYRTRKSGMQEKRVINHRMEGYFVGVCLWVDKGGVGEGGEDCVWVWDQSGDRCVNSTL